LTEILISDIGIERDIDHGFCSGILIKDVDRNIDQGLYRDVDQGY
jgi:hypothetical protein